MLFQPSLPPAIRIPKPAVKKQKQAESFKSRKLTLKEFSAWVQVDGKPLDCFMPYANVKQKEANCWIASVVGKEFSVVFFKDDVTKCNCEVNLFLDGLNADGWVSYKDEAECKMTFEYAWTSETTKHKFKFAPMELVDGEATLGDAQGNKDCERKSGEIRLVVTRITHVKKEKPKKAQKGKGKNKLDEQDISDEELKWLELPEPQKSHEGNGGKIVHQVVFGDEIKDHLPEPTAASPSTSSLAPKQKKAVHPEDIPYFTFDRHEDIATFIFRYRPRETLERSQIIRTPSATMTKATATSTPGAGPSRGASTAQTQGTPTRAGSTRSTEQQQQQQEDAAQTPTPSQSNALTCEESDDDFYVRTPEPDISASASEAAQHLNQSAQEDGHCVPGSRSTSGSQQPLEVQVRVESPEPATSGMIPSTLSIIGKRKTPTPNTQVKIEEPDSAKRIKLEADLDEGVMSQQPRVAPGVKEEEREDIIYDADDAKRIESLQAELEKIKNSYYTVFFYMSHTQQVPSRERKTRGREDASSHPSWCSNALLRGPSRTHVSSVFSRNSYQGKRGQGFSKATDMLAAVTSFPS
ncbi:hypothetical protein NLJ89_g6549 [Agrocybe chaxingu]|uniref:DUF7918 domain-containing protein n=1 Tax=Agrocybe chaxingu TaxID=84603 RepID=A0A9W8MSK9_9AGAR|nr:hypothetical protein NLJ89_g6549 [Agrocybe chaxingu]